MKLYKLFIISSSIIIVNIIFVYILFYYNPPQKIINIKPATYMSMTWNNEGNKIAYYEKDNGRMVISIYDISDQSSEIIIPEKEIMTDSSLGFSDDGKFLSYFWRNDKRKAVDIINIENGNSILANNFPKKQDLFLTDGGGPKDAIIWLDKKVVIYENSIPFQRTGIMFFNVESGEEENFIPYSQKPSLSPNKEYLAYVVSSGNEFSVHRLNLQTKEVDMLVKNIGGYIYGLKWSPDSSMIAVSYTKNISENNNVSQVAIIDKNNDLVAISDQNEFSSPKWLDNNNLLLTMIKTSGTIFQSKSVVGLYLYDLNSKNFQLISRKVRSGFYYLRPNSNEVFYQFGNNIESIDVKRIFQPTGIYYLRYKLGIGQR